NKNLKIRIYPSKADKNDKGDKIVSMAKIDSNMAHVRFVWNKLLEFVNYFTNLLTQNGYQKHFKIYQNEFNMLLNWLKEENNFLKKSESSSLQQIYKDLIIAFKRFFQYDLKSGYPRFKSRKNPRDSFRIMNNNNNIRIQKDKYGFDKLNLAKHGLVKFKTSKKYKEYLRRGSDPNDPTVKIKHATIKKEHDHYYAIVNIECICIPVEKNTLSEKIGIDIGCGKLAVLSNKQEITNLDLSKETTKIIHYQKTMSYSKKDSIRYHEAHRLYRKWMTKLINKRDDYYDKMTIQIVKNSSLVVVQNENIIAWKHNKHLSRKLQINAPRIFMDKLEYKCNWNDTTFIKVPQDFPSTQICSQCGTKNPKISGIGQLDIRNWKCPDCGYVHDRDLNASINILNKGLEIVGTTVQ
ncbi:transposase, partial [Methanobrevibacter sp.]|uniref:RNA-guided endonuclease InsQ/TnpB family protein n=1 Tax=Methanobrevibacter sp. TaxID=66852 RepID=UPI0025E4310E